MVLVVRVRMEYTRGPGDRLLLLCSTPCHFCRADFFR
jgi:hypothetical protein